MAAVRKNDIKMVELLLVYGIDKTLKNSGGLTAEDIARKKKNLEIADLIKNWESGRNIKG